MKVEEILKKVNFNAHGLVPVIAVDHITGEVLMLAYANEEALRKTLETGFAHYYSRSRKSLWKKGETSGNLQRIVALRRDCDGDAVIYEVIQAGPACHTGKRSCFFEELTRWENSAPDYPFLKALEKILHERKENLPEGSYTAKIFRGAPEKIAEKLREEAEEFIEAVEKKEREDVIWEAADLLFFLMMGLVWRNVEIKEVLEHLWQRHIKKKGGDENGG